MIRIRKPPTPEILVTKGRAKHQEMCEAYDEGVREFEFDKELYGHKTVKETLSTAQHDKCFLCEAKITHISSGDIEHFRPKGGYRQSQAHKLLKPGYFWLAYEWSNLFFVCEHCNRRYKKNLFPLVDDGMRVSSWRDNISQEEPLFINPEQDQPEDFLSFRGEDIFAIGNNPKGEATCKGAGLDRPQLVADRKDTLKKICLLYRLAQDSPPTPFREAAQQLIESYINSDAGEYTLMVRANLANEFEFFVP